MGEALASAEEIDVWRGRERVNPPTNSSWYFRIGNLSKRTHNQCWRYAATLGRRLRFNGIRHDELTSKNCSFLRLGQSLSECHIALALDCKIGCPDLISSLVTTLAIRVVDISRIKRLTDEKQRLSRRVVQYIIA